MKDGLTVFVVNPKSAGGRTARRTRGLESLARERFDDVVMWQTTRAGEAVDLARRAVDRGAARVLAVGGDGTANEVVHGLMSAGGTAVARPAFGLLRAGTGSDTARSLALPRRWAATLDVIAGTTPKATDAIHGAYTDDSGTLATRWGINVTSFGLSGEVAMGVNSGPKRLPGALAYLVPTVAALRAHPNPEMLIEWEDVDGNPGKWRGFLLNAFLANGAWCGGGVRVGAPGGMHDGALLLTIIPKMPIRVAIRSLYRLYNGTIGEVPGVVVASVLKVRASGTRDGQVMAEIDGEQPGGSPLECRVEPSALRVYGLWSAVAGSHRLG